MVVLIVLVVLNAFSCGFVSGRTGSDAVVDDPNTTRSSGLTSGGVAASSALSILFVSLNKA